MRFFSFSLTYLCFAAMQPFIINVIFLILIFFFYLVERNTLGISLSPRGVSALVHLTT